MLRTGLEFARGTTEDCKRLVMGLFQQAEDVLGAYRVACAQFHTRDIVLVSAEWDASGLEAMPRARYVERLRRGLPTNGAKLLALLGIAHRSAHQVATLPTESDAFWLVVNRRGALPVMAVLLATPYAGGADAHEPTILH
jgi:hypothetical protein